MNRNVIEMKIILIYSVYFFLGMFAGSEIKSQDKVASFSRYTKTSAGYLMVLRQGDNVFAELEAMAVKENISFANFTGIGFFGKVQFGYFNKTTKKYELREFADVEAVSVTGSIAWENNKPSLHMHCVVGDKDMNAFGGHILSGVVGTGSLEVYIVINDKKLERKEDISIGAKVLEIKSN
jgi:predicted DNA-binding protein with PD1-like motif